MTNEAEEKWIRAMADAEDKCGCISVGGLACELHQYVGPEEPHHDTKQVIVIRKDLNMRKGKMIAQGAHASMAVILDLLRSVNWQPDDLSEAVKDWLRGKFTKIVVYVNSEQELFDVYAKAANAQLPASLIRDAGLTEFKEPTYTAIAIGPAYGDVVDTITKELPLL